MSSKSYCVVADCNSGRAKLTDGNSEHLCSFYRFPRDPALFNLWLAKCKPQDGFNVSSARVCSAHFLPSDFEPDPKSELLEFPLRKILKPSAVPSIFPTRNQTIIQPVRGSVRQGRRKQVFNNLLKTNVDPDGELKGGDSTLKEEDKFERDEEFKVEELEPWDQAQVELRFHCLICKTLTRNEGNYLNDPKNKDELTNLFNKLCLAFKLKFPFQNQTWDFASEPFPFCLSCQEETLILCSLLDELESIEKKVNASVQKLSSLILTTESVTMAAAGTGEWNFSDHRRREELKEKYGSFRKAVVNRLNPKVHLQHCDQHPAPSSAQAFEPTATTDKTYPEAAVKENTNISTAPDIFENDVCDTELDPPLEPETESSTEVELETTEVPATSWVETLEAKPSCRTVKALPAAVAKQTKKPYHFVRLIDEITKTYHVEGFEFRELENGYECLTCKNVYPFGKLRADSPRSQYKRANIKMHIEKSHIRSTLGFCDICQKEYFNLAAHKRGVHVGDSARRLCEVCGKEFKSYNHLASHRYNFHRVPKREFKQREKNFECSTCGKKFVLQASLNAHSRSHVQEKPYMCEYCGKCFFSWGAWKTHVDGVHEGKFSCDQCGRKFGRKQGLQSHVTRVHDGIKSAPSVKGR